MHTDKFGYYQVGQFKTYSKIEAIELHAITGIHPEWRFNDLAFGSYDWTKEPSDDLETLYAARAWKIRKKYDHIVLFYSGGCDSFNMVNTFIKNKIPFEEIATFSYAKADPDKDSWFRSELVRVAYPQIQKWHGADVSFRHRDIDLSDIALKILLDRHYLTNRAYYSNLHFGNNILARSYIRESEPEYQQIMESGKSLVFVWGLEKPRVYQENGRLCLKFLDMLDTAVASRTQMLNREDEHDELFYWSPDALDLMCKQGHILRRFIKTHKVFDRGRDFSDYNSEEKISFTLDLDMSFRHLISHLIYPDWDINTFSVGKPTLKITSPRDQIWTRDVVFSKQTENVLAHLSQLDRYWLNDPTNPNKGVKGCISRAYYLE